MYGQNNGYYMPNYQPYMMNNGAMPDMLNQYKQMQQPQPKPSELIWVQGEAGAKGYLVAPNNTVVLWDTEKPTIYVKSADGTGLPTMRVLDFVERGTEKPQNDLVKHECTCGDKFVTKEQFEDLKGDFERLKGIIENKQTKKSKGGEE